LSRFNPHVALIWVVLVINYEKTAPSDSAELVAGRQSLQKGSRDSFQRVGRG
jgi:hypothetical protein